jgi:hypothetical protein
MQGVEAYKLPTTGAAREQLRVKGQFWTPDWIAEAMVEYVLTDTGGRYTTGITLFDPAVGAGAFFRAAKKAANEKGVDVTLAGMDIDPAPLDQAIQFGLVPDDLTHVTVGDFVCEPPPEKFSAIVANPPYIRHHRLPPEMKEELKRLSLQTTGKVLDGRAGLHIYFLIRALTLLVEDGRLAFIMPADTCEGKFAYDLWRWIAANYALEAVITFAPEASPFPNVDTNPLIFLIRNRPPKEKFKWATCYVSQTNILKAWVRSDFAAKPDKGLAVIQRKLEEGLETGLSRPPTTEKIGKYVLGDFLQVVRGVATGANDFFFLTEEQIRQTGIPECYFVRAVGRTRDVPGDEITPETLETLQAKGRPTFLLALNGGEFEKYPDELKRYLQKGETLGLPKRPLISQRKPWYKTESRLAPPFLFAYLGRRNVRFIRNTAGIIPLTSFLCLYPRANEEKYIERLWCILGHPDTVANLAMIGKSYGDGAIKVEPRALEKLPIPDYVIALFGLPVQLRLLEDKTHYETVIDLK